MGRVSQKVFEEVKSKIHHGEFEVGKYLPTVQALSNQFGASYETVRKALKMLEQVGYVKSTYGHGYMVMKKEIDGSTGRIVYLVKSNISGQSTMKLISALDKMCLKLGLTFVVIASNTDVSSLIEQLRSLNPTGVLLDEGSTEESKFIRDLNCPAIVINDWDVSGNFDSIMQDGQMGCFLAMQKALANGCKSFGWFGPVEKDIHSMDRLGVVLASLAAHGLSIPKSLFRITDIDPSQEEAESYLKLKNRPDMIISPWYNTSTTLLHAANALKLKIGKDVGLIGWCTEDEIENYRNKSNQNNLMITWSVSQLAELAIHALLDRARNPDKALLRIKLPVTLSGSL